MPLNKHQSIPMSFHKFVLIFIFAFMLAAARKSFCFEPMQLPINTPVTVTLMLDTTYTCDKQTALFAKKSVLRRLKPNNAMHDSKISSLSIISKSPDSVVFFAILGSTSAETYSNICIESDKLKSVTLSSIDTTPSEYQKMLSEKEKSDLLLGAIAVIALGAIIVYGVVYVVSGALMVP